MLCIGLLLLFAQRIHAQQSRNARLRPPLQRFFEAFFASEASTRSTVWVASPAAAAYQRSCSQAPLWSTQSVTVSALPLTVVSCL